VIAQRAQDTPHDKVRVLQRKLYQAAKAAPQRTFGLLYDKVYKVIDADLQACFASLPHNGIIAAVARRIRDPWILRLLRRWLKAGILEEGSIWTAIAGTPEGGELSPVLANAYMHAFGEVWETKMRGTRLTRCSDDYVILCRGNPQPWFRRMEGLITELGLTVNAAKTRIVDATAGFDFLGMHFRLKPMRSNPKRLFCYRWPRIRISNGFFTPPPAALAASPARSDGQPQRRVVRRGTANRGLDRQIRRGAAED
jgi:hypothetical protein